MRARWSFLDETSNPDDDDPGPWPRPARDEGGGRAPRNHGPNVSCLAALTPTGISVPLVLEGAVDGQVFRQWLREWLLPALAPGTTIVLDNLNVHRNPAVREAVEAAACHLRYLPAHSPDFNPIELAFSKLKTHLRGAASGTYDTLVDAIGVGFDGISAADAIAWYRHCGYHVNPPEAVQPL